ncbi:MAG: hypothetical protein ACTSPY_14830 [Candidatus Helarchaeota archaeon]
MKKSELSKCCRRNLRTLRNSIAVFCNQLKGGSSPESDDEFNSIFSYTPTFFDKTKKPSHALIRTSYRVCFVDKDWLRLGKDIWITRRTGKKYRLNFLVNSSNPSDLIDAESRIDKLLEDLDFTVIEDKNLRYIIKKRIPKVLLSTKDGIYVYSYPIDSEDSLTLGYMESLRNFGNELAILKFTESSLKDHDSLKQIGESLELSNNMIQFNISIPIDKYLTFSIIQVNPNHIYDMVTRNMIFLAMKFLREVLRRNNLLDIPFNNRIDIYKDAFDKPLFGGLSASQILSDIQFGNEIAIHPFINMIFREITSSMDQNMQMYIFNAFTSNIVAGDYHHTVINESDYPQIKQPFYDDLLKYQSKIIRVISANSISAAVLKGITNDDRIFTIPIKYKTQFKGDFYRITPPILSFYLVFIDTLEKFYKYETQMKWLANFLRRVIPFCDTIYLRPEMDQNGRRTTRTITINNMDIRLPDFSFLNKKKRQDLRNYIHESKSDLMKNTIIKIVQIISYCTENLDLKYID